MGNATNVLDEADVFMVTATDTQECQLGYSLDF